MPRATEPRGLSPLRLTDLTSTRVAPSFARSARERIELILDHRVRYQVDGGEPCGELVAQAVARRQLGRGGVGGLRLAAGVPDEDLQRQVERRQRHRRHYGRPCDRISEDDDLGVAELEADRFRL